MFENFLTHCLFLLRIGEYEYLEKLILKQREILEEK